MVFDKVKKAVDWVFGETNQQKLKKLQSYLDQVNSFSDQISCLSDSDLRAKTDEFKNRLTEGATTDSLLPEAFAVVREVAARQVNMRPFDVQVLGAVVLHQKRIAEMKTGEGKTLVATMPAYLNALTGKVHVVTVNDYLAGRDREWMGPIYEQLGLKVGLIQEEMGIQERKKAYQADLIYGTNNQFGFDYLRDHMAISPEQRVQTGLHYAIIDEIDNILIDEARTPLIISGSTQESNRKYKRVARIATRFERGKDFDIDEKARQITLTEYGMEKAEKVLTVENIYSPQNIGFLHHLELALKARWLFKKDQDYIVKDGRVVIVDEFTGRLMEDRRYSDGLHQALEAKEGMSIQRESQTLAQITLQHYFLLYNSIAGMTGTAKTEEEEFKEIYGLDVVVVPTNKKLIRDNRPDVIFKTKEAKYKAIVDEIDKMHEEERPVLVGTNSIEKSEKLSGMLKKRDLKHEVLNAKYHQKEASIIQDSGQKNAITIATNMAGRGTDIKLGEGVAEIRGLHVLGCQRHESRRIDNQLRGRAGRQGDPGSSQFFVALEDDLLRLFGGDRLKGIMDRLGMEDGQSVKHDMLTRAIRRAQKKVEDRNFRIRKQVLEYDQVMAQQRNAIYKLRDRFLIDETEQVPEEKRDNWERYIEDILSGYANTLIQRYLSGEKIDLEGLGREAGEFQNATLDTPKLVELSHQESRDMILQFLVRNLEKQRENLDGNFEKIAKLMILKIVDEAWRRHLYLLDDLMEGIGWRSYGGSDPLVEFKKESFRLFQEMLQRVEEEIVNYLIKPELKLERAEYGRRQDFEKLRYKHEPVKQEIRTPDQRGKAKKKEPRQVKDEPGRNDPCPCGSGKKYKHCCGK